MEHVNTRQWFSFSCFWSWIKSFRINSRKLRPHLTDWKLGPLVLTNPKRFELQLHNSDLTYVCCEDLFTRNTKRIQTPLRCTAKFTEKQVLACTLAPPHTKKTSATQGSWRTSPGANESIYVVGWSVLFSFIYFFWHDWWGFLAPDNLENHANEGKGKKKKKEQEEKAMAALLVFIFATLTGRGLFGGNVFKNPARWRIRQNC